MTAAVSILLVSGRLSYCFAIGLLSLGKVLCVIIVTRVAGLSLECCSEKVDFSRVDLKLGPSALREYLVSARFTNSEIGEVEIINSGSIVYMTDAIVAA